MNHWLCLVSLVLSVVFMTPYQAHAAGRLRAGDPPPDSYRRSLMGRAPQAPMVATPVYRTPAVPGAENGAIEPREQAGIRRYLIVVNDDLYESIDDVLATYIDDVEAEGRTIEVVRLGTSTPEGLRNLLISKYNEPDSLEGCYFIGLLPAAFFRHDDDDGATFPCEMFFMDMDGTWIDTNADGYPDEHGAGSGDEGPEIYCGRTVAHNLTLESGETEVSLIRRYLGKVHDYRQGLITGTGKACIYTDDDWRWWHDDFCINALYAWDDLDGYSEPSETVAADYLVKLQGPYEFMRIACHSWPGGHWFKIGDEWNGGLVYSEDIVDNPPSHLLFYNLYACSNARWTTTNCMGVWYTMNSGPGLGAWGSTKSGGANNGEVFYQRVGEYHCFGYAVQEWFDDFAPYDTGEIAWTFGMLWLGDPTLWRSRVAPSEFSLSSPNDGAEHPQPDVWLSWDASEPAGVDETVTYTLTIDNDDDFSSPELVVEDIADTTYHVTSADGLWSIWQHWKVIATTNFGKSHECDGPRAFSIAFDVDLDKMGDAWESANGLDPTDPTDALHDSDGDWLLNREEHDLNSDPQNGQSPTWLCVDAANAGDPAQDGTPAHPYEAIQTAIDAATAPTVVKVLPGLYTEAVVMADGVWVVGVRHDRRGQRGRRRVVDRHCRRAAGRVRDHLRRRLQRHPHRRCLADDPHLHDHREQARRRLRQLRVARLAQLPHRRQPQRRLLADGHRGGHHHQLHGRQQRDLRHRAVVGHRDDDQRDRLRQRRRRRGRFGAFHADVLQHRRRRLCRHRRQHLDRPAVRQRSSAQLLPEPDGSGPGRRQPVRRHGRPGDAHRARSPNHADRQPA